MASRCFKCKSAFTAHLPVFHQRPGMDIGLCCGTPHCPFALCDSCALRHVQEQYPCMQAGGDCSTPRDCDVAADVEVQLGAECVYVAGSIVVSHEAKPSYKALIGAELHHKLHDNVAIALTKDVYCAACRASPTRGKLLVLAMAASRGQP